MYDLVLDVETTIDWSKKGGSPSPYIETNKLVSIGLEPLVTDVCEYFCFYHNEEPATEGGYTRVQYHLNNCSMLIGHNIKFDLQWLWAANFEYTGSVYDTMVQEYLNAGGQWVNTDLGSCLDRHGLAGKKSDLTEGYLKKKIGFEAMPWPIVLEYGIQDVKGTKQLFLAQTGAQ